MPTSTREDIQEWMIQAYGLGRRGTNDGTSGNKTTFSDGSELGGPSGAEGIEPGSDVWGRMDATVGGGGAVTFALSRVSTRPTTAAGSLVVTPALTALGENITTANNDMTFSILKRPLRYTKLYEAIDWAVTTKFWEKLRLPITSVLDGDMLRTTAATPEWVATDGAGGANDPTLAKVAATYPLGLRVLRVTNNATGAGDYALSATIPVEELKSYYLEATGMIGSTGAAADAGTLVLYDETNGASITLSEVDINRFEPEILRNTVTMPSGCEQVTIRLTCTAVGDIIDWANIIFRKDDSREFVVQDRDASVDRLGKLYAATIDVWGARGATMQQVAAEPELLTAGLWVYKTDVSLAGKSLWYDEWRRPAALTADTSTVALDKESVAAVAAEHLLQPFADRDDWRRTYARAATDAARVLSKLRTHERSYDISPTEHVLAET